MYFDVFEPFRTFSFPLSSDWLLQLSIVTFYTRSFKFFSILTSNYYMIYYHLKVTICNDEWFLYFGGYYDDYSDDDDKRRWWYTSVASLDSACVIPESDSGNSREILWRWINGRSSPAIITVIYTVHPLVKPLLRFLNIITSRYTFLPMTLLLCRRYCGSGSSW